MFVCQVSEVALRYHTGCGSEGGVSAVSRCCQSLHVPTSKANVCELCSSPSVMTSVCSVPELQTVVGLYLRHVPMSSTSCGHVQNSYSPYSRYSACCRPLEKPEHRLLLDDSITGLQCRTNKTLRFYLLDSELNWQLARRLGAPVARSALPFITIINLRDETHYVLNDTDSLGTQTHTHTRTL